MLSMKNYWQNLSRKLVLRDPANYYLDILLQVFGTSGRGHKEPGVHEVQLSGYHRSERRLRHVRQKLHMDMAKTES